MPLEVIAQFMDFDKKSIALIEAEFRHKYDGTILKINNKYVTISGINIEKDMIYTIEFGGMIPNTIEEYNPEIGLYATKTNLIFISRIPQRQYLKSFKFNANYQLTRLDGIYGIFNPEKYEYKGICTIFNSKVFLYKKQIGIAENKTIYLYPPYYDKYKLDVKELCPNYKIISLDVFPHL